MNRADCCQDRLVGARIVVSQTADYEAHGGVGGDPVSCGSVDEAESPIEEQDLIIKVCELGTAGRYVTVVGPNRVYPDTDQLYLSLFEVAVYGECPPLSEEAMGGTLSAAAAAAAESLGANCEITMGTEGPLSFADAERSCNAAGGHLASIHNEQEADYARALIANSPYVAYGEAWIGLNDLHVECMCHGDCFVWTDGTPNDFATMWRPTEPDDGLGEGDIDCDDVVAGRRPPCRDDSAAMQAATISLITPHGQTCAQVARDCPVAETSCGTLGGTNYEPMVCYNFITTGNEPCSCSCPPVSEDCTALTGTLSGPDTGWVDTVCHDEKPYLCRVCDAPQKDGRGR